MIRSNPAAAPWFFGGRIALTAAGAGAGAATVSGTRQTHYSYSLERTGISREVNRSRGQFKFSQ